MAAIFDGNDVISESPTDSPSARVASQDESEFEFLFLEHYERVLRLLIRLTGDRGQAEELSNEVFWRLSRRPASWLLTQNIGPWLYRAAMNAGIDAIRASGKRTRYEGSAARDTKDGLHHNGPLEDLLRDENRRRVREALSALDPVCAQLLLMRSGGSSYKEIAESLGVSVGSVGTLLNRAEEKFRKKYLALTVKEKAR
jgi:RNA polymerase sigma factor (sigma-70 family)